MISISKKDGSGKRTLGISRLRPTRVKNDIAGWLELKVGSGCYIFPLTEKNISGIIKELGKYKGLAK